MAFTARAAKREDVAEIASLLGRYLAETYDSTWSGREESLLRDGFGSEFSTCVVERSSGVLVGFVIWHRAYDLHHSMAGGEILDLYVVPEVRGLGLAVMLLCQAARDVEGAGGRFLKGEAVSSGTGGALYGRAAVLETMEKATLSGRAFRELARLANRPVRQVLRELPIRSWNFEA